ncbi:hypothetical protein E2C01_071570 [Portunus trituberculatus]|uniref:Uncharacterized protein n=1 Tax=Portunus trituberculatus TaxID=210409 RepID=A0A5B7I4S6_PORTR|nr:hypothetical protein [Portunus trituberculatus]
MLVVSELVVRQFKASQICGLGKLVSIKVYGQVFETMCELGKQNRLFERKKPERNARTVGWRKAVLGKGQLETFPAAKPLQGILKLHEARHM